jgi:hypothetical protein
MQISSFPRNIFEEAVFSSFYVFGAFVKNQVGSYMDLYLILLSVPLDFMSFSFLCQFYAVFIAMALQCGFVML